MLFVKGKVNGGRERGRSQLVRQKRFIKLSAGLSVNVRKVEDTDSLSNNA